MIVNIRTEYLGKFKNFDIQFTRETLEKFLLNQSVFYKLELHIRYIFSSDAL